MKKGKGGPIKDNPITDMKWPDKGRKNMEMPKKGPVACDPIRNFKWMDKGRKNGG